MAKAVFDSLAGTSYDDRIEERYHFPARRDYLAVAHAAVGDWIVYRETRSNSGRRSYVGVARVDGIEADRRDPTHAYARVSNFLAFEPPVPFGAHPLGYWETWLRRLPERRQVGSRLQGASMRPLTEPDFHELVRAGLSHTLSPESLLRYGDAGVEDEGLALLGALTGDSQAEDVAARRVEQMLVNRKIRDANFRRLVCEAYDDTCAVTGLKIVNGGGRSEVQAAHIWPVAEGGPDTVQNGIALSGTIHWLFDRHMIALTDDYRLLVSHNKVPGELRGLFQQQMDRIRLPRDERRWPNLRYIQRHRERFLAA